MIAGGVSCHQAARLLLLLLLPLLLLLQQLAGFSAWQARHPRAVTTILALQRRMLPGTLCQLAPAASCCCRVLLAVRAENASLPLEPASSCSNMISGGGAS